MSESETVYDIQWIRSILPHRYPMLLVDRVTELVPGQRIVAVKNVTANEEVFLGHFPGNPVYPGVLVIEGMAQAGGILLLYGKSEEERRHKLTYFTAIDRARFRRPVIPGDQLRYEVTVVRLRSTAAKLEARALVNGTVAAQARLSTALVDRPE